MMLDTKSNSSLKPFKAWTRVPSLTVKFRDDND